MAIIVGSGSTVYLTPNRVGLGSTTTAGRDAGVGTATGYTIYNTDTVQIEVYDGTPGDPAPGPAPAPPPPTWMV